MNVSTLWLLFWKTKWKQLFNSSMLFMVKYDKTLLSVRWVTNLAPDSYLLCCCRWKGFWKQPFLQAIWNLKIEKLGRKWLNKANVFKERVIYIERDKKRKICQKKETVCNLQSFNCFYSKMTFCLVKLLHAWFNVKSCGGIMTPWDSFLLLKADFERMW